MHTNAITHINAITKYTKVQETQRTRKGSSQEF